MRFRKKTNGVSSNIQSPPYVDLLKINKNHQRQVTTSQKHQRQLISHQNHPQHTAQQHKKQWHHDPLLSPPFSGSSFEGKSDHRTLRDRALSALHGDAIFLHVTKFFLCFICYYSIGTGSACMLTKGEFF